ncbi:MAG: acyl carrier protein [Deltaproteobacteria bacterium]|nr:acyl carrier protein [Deltaproteobacteria bacterium]
MQEQEILNRVMAAVKPYAGNPVRLTSASASTRLVEDLKINSARLVDIIISFEDVFNIRISDDEAERIDTVGDVLKMVKSKLN